MVKCYYHLYASNFIFTEPILTCAAYVSLVTACPLLLLLLLLYIRNPP